MTERPILFSAPMVKALLAGTKTQTRRLFKDSPRKDGAKLLPELLQKIGVGAACPYGKPGDRLWVCETWGFRGRGVNFGGTSDNGATTDISIEYAADESKRTIIRPSEGIDEQLPEQHCLPKLKGHDTRGTEHYEKCLTAYWRKWQPSIFMRRWASRITLEITHVRVERLASITCGDSIAEGIEQVEPCPEQHEAWRNYAGGHGHRSPVASYASLWESINGKGSWAENPWVWVLNFKKATAASLSHPRGEK